MKKIISCIAVITFLLSVPASLYAEQAPEQELKEIMVKKSDKFFDILEKYAGDCDVRQEKILNEVTPLFDFDLMARLALDKKTWRSLSKEQRASFSDLFISRVKDSYLSKLDLFADFKVKIEDSVRVKKNRIEVTALLKTKADTKKLVYKFYMTKEKKWLIYDISVVGVSFLQSYRAQFSSFLRKHTFEELLKEIGTIDHLENGELKA